MVAKSAIKKNMGWWSSVLSIGVFEEVPPEVDFSLAPRGTRSRVAKEGDTVHEAKYLASKLYPGSGLVVPTLRLVLLGLIGPRSWLRKPWLAVISYERFSNRPRIRDLTIDFPVISHDALRFFIIFHWFLMIFYVFSMIFQYFQFFSHRFLMIFREMRFEGRASGRRRGLQPGPLAARRLPHCPAQRATEGGWSLEMLGFRGILLGFYSDFTRILPGSHGISYEFYGNSPGIGLLGKCASDTPPIQWWWTNEGWFHGIWLESMRI